MKKSGSTAGERMIASARQALEFGAGHAENGCVVHIADEIGVKAIRERSALPQGEFGRPLGHRRRVPSGPGR